MSSEMFEEFETLSSKWPVQGSVLEIGAVPASDSLLNLGAFRSVASRVGINLDGSESYKIGEDQRANEYDIVKGNANNMSCFEDRIVRCGYLYFGFRARQIFLEIIGRI